MFVKQVSVFLENQSGRLAEVTRLLAKEGINIRAFSMADTTHFGILRFVVDRPEDAVKLLKEQGFTARVTEVIGVKVKDTPGSFSEVLGLLGDAGITVEYGYAFVQTSAEHAKVLLRAFDNEKAIEILKEKGFPILSHEEVYQNI